MALILNPMWRMRREQGYVLLYRLTDIGTVAEQSFIHPLKAITIALFDGKRTVEDVAHALNYVTGRPVEPHNVKQFLDENSRYFIEASEVSERLRRRYDPLEFVMDADSIDFTFKRPLAPLSLVYMVTNACRTNCIYCYAERQRHGKGGPLLPLPRVKELIEETAELRIPVIHFSGGDPFMHPDILDILEHTVARDILPVISTKCVLSEATVDRLAEIGIPRVQISIDSPDPDTIFLLTGARNYLEEMIPVIKRLKAKGIKVATKTVLTSYNVRQVPALVDLLASLGVDDIGLGEYVRSLYRHLDDNLFMSHEDLKWLDETVQRLREKYSSTSISTSWVFAPEPKSRREKERAFLNRARCTAGMQQLAIYPDGKVVPCEEVPSTPEFVVGDLSKQSILEVWNSERLMQLIRPPKEKFLGQPCYDCLDFYECHAFLGRCFVHALKAYGTPYAPPPECPKSSPSGLRLQTSPICVDPKSSQSSDCDSC